MAVPEASMREENRVVSLQHKVGATSELPVMQAETKASGMKPGAKKHFRFCIESPDAGHHPASDFRAYDISHACR